MNEATDAIARRRLSSGHHRFVYAVSTPGDSAPQSDGQETQPTTGNDYRGASLTGHAVLGYASSTLVGCLRNRTKPVCTAG
jgi:hypothetical protein